MHFTHERFEKNRLPMKPIFVINVSYKDFSSEGMVETPGGQTVDSDMYRADGLAVLLIVCKR